MQEIVRKDYLDLVSLSGPTILECCLSDVLASGLPSAVRIVEHSSVPADEIVVRGALIAGIGESLPDRAGAILLLVTGDGGAGQFEGMLRDAARRGYGAVVVRSAVPGLQECVHAAKDAGIALFTADDSLSWREVAAAFDSAIATHTAQHRQSPAAYGDDLHAIADAVAAVIGGSVAIEDMSHRVIAYSSIPGQRIDAVRSAGILDRSVPPDPGDNERYGTVMKSSGVVRFDREGEELARAAVAIRAGDMPLGSMWAIEGDGEMDRDDGATLQEGARLAALYMLRARQNIAYDQQLQSEALMTLLNGSGDTASARAHLRIRPGEPIALVAFSVGAPDNRAMEAATARETRSVARGIMALHPRSIVAISGTVIYILATGPSAEQTATLVSESATTATARSLPRSVCAIVVDSDAARLLADVREEADDILAALWLDPHRSIATIDEVRPQVLMRHMMIELARRPRLVNPAFIDLFRAQSRSQDLALSIDAWFNARFEISRAAASLGIHPNTLRYRLRRFSETSGVDLEDIDSLLSLRMQMKSIALKQARDDQAT